MQEKLNSPLAQPRSQTLSTGSPSPAPKASAQAPKYSPGMIQSVENETRKNDSHNRSRQDGGLTVLAPEADRLAHAKRQEHIAGGGAVDWTDAAGIEKAWKSGLLSTEEGIHLVESLMGGGRRQQQSAQGPVGGFGAPAPELQRVPGLRAGGRHPHQSQAFMDSFSARKNAIRHNTAVMDWAKGQATLGSQERGQDLMAQSHANKDTLEKRQQDMQKEQWGRSNELMAKDIESRRNPIGGSGNGLFGGFDTFDDWLTDLGLALQD